MTVVATKDSRKVVPNAGFVNPIAFNQYVEVSTHIKVYADTTLLSTGTHYSISGIGDLAGIEVTISAAGLLLDPDNWVVLHDPLIDQDSDLSVGGTFGAAYETGLDKLTRRMQAMENKIGRALKAGVDTTIEYALPAAVAGLLIGFNADGTQLETKTTAADAVAAAAVGLALLASETQADGRTALGLGTAAVKNTGTSGDAVPLLNAANTWSGAQTIALSAAATNLTLQTTEDGAAAGPRLDLTRISASPAANDTIGQIRFLGRDSAANSVFYAQLFCTIVDPTDTSEDGRLDIWTTTAGAQALRMSVGQGAVVGSPTGGDKGAGTLNATTLYENGVSLSAKYYVLNADGGATLSHTAATQPIEHTPFGGLFNSAAASSVAHLELTGLHTGPRFTAAFTIETEGTNPNGPGSSVYPVWLHSQKRDYLTATGSGEVDGLYILVNQGINGDVGGILIGVNKVDGGTGGITCIESVATRIDGTGAAVLSNDSVVNFLEGVGALSAGGGHGFYSEAREGTIYSAFTAAAGTDFGANLTNFFVGALSRSPSDIRFKVSTAGVLSLTSVTAQNMLELITVESGAAAGSGILLDRVSSTPAAGDIISQILFRGRNDAAAQTAYGSIVVTAQNVTAASAVGRFGFFTANAGASTERMRIASGVYHPSAVGGDKGDNTINYGAVYDDNVLLTDYVFDKWLGREIAYSDRVREVADNLDPSMFHLATFADFSRENGRLYGMPDLNDAINGLVKEYSLGAMIQKLWQTAELMSIHDAELLNRVTALEERLA